MNRGILLLVWRHAAYHWGRSLILTAVLAVTIYLPCAATLLIDRHEDVMRRRGESTPLILGARGNRYDLTMALLFFRREDLKPLLWAELRTLSDPAHADVIPVSVRHSAQEAPLVGVDPAYYTFRQLTLRDGSIPLQIGDVALGAAVAQRLGLAVGDSIFSDQEELYDITRPPALKMRICGIFNPSGQPDDDVVFTDIRTTWIVDGAAHGHDDPQSVDPALRIGGTPESPILSEAFIEYQEVTPENLDSFHIHGDPGDMPLTGALILPRNDRSASIIKARANLSPLYQMIVPRDVIDELLSFVFRAKTLFDALMLLLAATTLTLGALVMLFSARIRAREMETLHRIGAGRRVEIALHGLELALILSAAAGIAALGVGLTLILGPDLVQFLT